MNFSVFFEEYKLVINDCKTKHSLKKLNGTISVY